MGCGDDIPENEEDNGSVMEDDANVGSRSDGDDTFHQKFR